MDRLRTIYLISFTFDHVLAGQTDHYKAPLIMILNLLHVSPCSDYSHLLQELILLFQIYYKKIHNGVDRNPPVYSSV